MARAKRKQQSTRRAPVGPPSDRSVTSRRRRWLLRAAVVVLCAVHFALAVTSVHHKSNTYDELAHLTAGYSYLKTNDFRLGVPHPPLANIWAAAPLLDDGLRFPPLHQSAWHTSNVWSIGRQFFYDPDDGNPDRIDAALAAGRSMIALLSTGLGLLVFAWSRRLFGDAGGLISLTAYAFSPTMLAHAPLVTTDMAAAFFFLASLAGVTAVLVRISPLTVVLGGLALAGLFLSKMSSVLIIPAGLIALALRVIDKRPLTIGWRRRSREIRSRLARLGCWLGGLAVWVVIAWAGLWAGYGMRYTAFKDATPGVDRFYSNITPPEGQDVWEWNLRKIEHLEPYVAFARTHHLFPEAYIYSAVYGAQTARGRASFLNGEYSLYGHRWFFPYAFLAKTPLAIFALLLAALLSPLLWRRIAASHADGVGAEADSAHSVASGLPSSAWPLIVDTAPLWGFFIVYWIASQRTNLNIGHRHILPTYPILFIFAGAAAVFLCSKYKAVRAVPPTLLALLAATSLWVYPNYLSFFNTFAGGPERGYRHLVDSSLDWGQDLPALANRLNAWRDAHPSEPIFLSYFGSGGSLARRHFGICEVTMLPIRTSSGDPIAAYQAGLYATSATNFQRLYMNLGGDLGYAPGAQWSPQAEQTYQTLRAAQGSLSTGARRRLEHLAFIRLLAWLNANRFPDETVNSSILVFALGPDDLEAAFAGSAPIEAGDDGGSPAANAR